MSDIRESRFWTDLLKKVLRIVFKNVSSTRPKHQHVVPHSEGWAVKGEGNERVTGVFDRQEDAIERAREIAINYRSSVIIHRKDGTIRESMSYK